MDNLTIEKIIEGIIIVSKNSRSLLQDSIILFEKQRYCRSFTLSQLAIEEVGKSLILFEVYISLLNGNRAEIDFKDLKQRFTSHNDKSFKSTLMEFKIYADNNPDKKGLNRFIKKILKEIDDCKKKYNDLKNQSLYVGYKDNNFIAPNQIITKRIASAHLIKANNRYSACVDEITKTFSIFSSAGLKYENSVIDFKKTIT